MKIMFTFPGQGVQTAGMLHQLPNSAINQQIMRTVQQVLQVNPLTLDSSVALQHTRAVQLCLLISAVVYALELKKQGIRPDFVSGLSIGAFPAAVIAGALSFDDALQLVALRGDLMQQAYPSGYGLVALLGLNQTQVTELLLQINSPQTPVYLANINAEDQLVIAGNDMALNLSINLALKKGALKAKRLAVSVPSHCALLAKPAAKLAEAMQHIKLRRPTIGYLSGSSGRVLWEPNQITDDLAFNMARTVHWHDAMVAAAERGVRLSIEMPPGSVLTKLTRSATSDVEALSLSQSGFTAVVDATHHYLKNSTL